MEIVSHFGHNVSRLAVAPRTARMPSHAIGPTGGRAEWRFEVVKLTKQSADFGIVVRDEAVMVAFYRDVMGLPYKGDMAVPGGVLHQFQLGASMLKLMVPPVPPAVSHALGDVEHSTGLRYW